MNYARQIAQDTLAWFPEMHRAFPEWVDRSIAETRAFDDWTAVPDSTTSSPAVLPIDVRVVARDTIDAALDLCREGLHPLVLNMASERVPGGGWLKGSQAQEELLFRRSTLGMALTRRFYPIPPRGGVFTPSIVVFRGADGRLMPWRDCQTLDFIAVPAVRRPRLTTEHRLTPDDAALTVDKMRLMFATARWAGHDSLVLGAFGNGAFGNPPSHTAELFANVIEEFPYFRRVVFAILTDRNDRHGNLAAYRRVFFSRTHQ